MVTRARLLDMGEVGALRALGLRAALGESVGRGGEPVLLLSRAATAAVALGEEAGGLASGDERDWQALGVPVVRLPGGAPPTLIAEGSLLITLLLPAGAGAALLPPSAADRDAWLRGLLAAPAGAPVTVGAGLMATVVERVAGAEALTLCLTWEVEPRLRRLAEASAPGLEPWAGAASSTSPAATAETLLGALEEQAGLELVPSMPMPAELDAVYDWERRLAATPAVAGPAGRGGA